ncbi:hypothetical protein D3C84_1178140 [compost metagenome]
MCNWNKIERPRHCQSCPGIAARPMDCRKIVFHNVIPAMIVQIRRRILQEIFMSVVLLEPILDIVLAVKQGADAK